jgi:hypothetical protein
MSNEIKIEELEVKDAFATGGSFVTPEGASYNGDWYEAPATKGDEDYRVIWTDVNWDAESEAACDWENPDYILEA